MFNYITDEEPYYKTEARRKAAIVFVVVIPACLSGRESCPLSDNAPRLRLSPS
jgi:hypothetical protein